MDDASGLVRKFMTDHELFTGKEKNILVGFSGGADSVCLLFMLKSFRDEGMFPDTRILAAHLNHGIRGEEALRDESFVRDFCLKNEIGLFVETADIPAVSRRTGESEETAGRRIRYEFFRRILKEEGGGIIATAHHKNDLVETVLFNICRGTGITGLAGIRAKQDDVVRPLICLTRAQIEVYNASAGLDYVNDSTNNDDIYTRNFLRNRVIPLLEESVNEGVVEHIYRLSEIALRADEFLVRESERLFSECEAAPDDIVIPSESYLSDRIIREYLYRRVFRELSGTAADLSSERMESIDGLFRVVSEGDSTCRVIELTHGINVIPSDRGIRFYKRGTQVRKQQKIREDICLCLLDDNIRKKLETGEEVRLASGNVTVVMRLTENFVKNDDTDYTKYFDYDKMNNTACLRYAEPDDHITVTSDGKKHGLNKELKNRKIPSASRKGILVLAQGNECLWAVGVRRGMGALAGENVRVLRVTVCLNK